MHLIYTLLLLVTTALAATIDLTTTAPDATLSERYTNTSAPDIPMDGKFWWQCSIFSTGAEKDIFKLIRDLDDNKGTISHTPARTCRRHRCLNTSAIYVCNDNDYGLDLDVDYIAVYANFIMTQCCVVNEYWKAQSGQFFDIKMGYNVIVAYGNCRHGIDEDAPAMGGPDDPWGPNGEPSCLPTGGHGINVNTTTLNNTGGNTTLNATGDLQPTDLSTTAPVASGTLDATGGLQERAVPDRNITAAATLIRPIPNHKQPIKCSLFSTAMHLDLEKLMDDLYYRDFHFACRTPARTCRRHRCLNTSAIYVCNDSDQELVLDCASIGDYAQLIEVDCCHDAKGVSGQLFNVELGYNVIVGYGNCRHNWDEDAPTLGPPEDPWGPNGKPKCDGTDDIWTPSGPGRIHPRAVLDLNTTTTLNTTTALNTTTTLNTTLNHPLDDPIHIQCDLFTTAKNRDLLRLISDMADNTQCFTPANTCRRHKCINTSAIYVCNDNDWELDLNCGDIGRMANNVVTGGCCAAGSGQSGQMKDDDGGYQVVIAYGNCRHNWDADRPGIGPPGDDKWGPNGAPKCDEPYIHG